ncbi:restriction endonuclease subunit S [Clostridium sp.]|jgi:type I restriction enzyme, S subunit|uniref:restriction endonuclease subunit S n=1 Tax=Clostridium sp. TaxID=1506 RepID=UPI0039F5F86D
MSSKECTLCKLRDIVKLQNGYAFKSKEFMENEVPIIRINNLQDNNVVIDKKICYPKKFLQNNRQYEVKKNDILISMSGSIGKIAKYTNKTPALLNQRVGKFEILKENNLNVEYLFYFLRSDRFQRAVIKDANGCVVRNISANSILECDIPMPSLETQNRIAQVLEKSEKIIEKRKEAIRLLDELVKSKFIEMFGDPIKNPKRLSKVELGKLGDWKTGGTPSRSNSEFYNGNIPWLSSGELNNIYCFGSNEMITERAIKESAAKIIERGSLLLGMYDTAALKSTINMIECSCNQAIAYAKLDKNLANTIFVYYCIQIGKNFYKSRQRGVRQKNLNLSMIKELEILMPDLELQNQFENFVRQVDKLKFKMEESLKKLESNFNLLIQRAFNGELFN